MRKFQHLFIIVTDSVLNLYYLLEKKLTWNLKNNCLKQLSAKIIKRS